MVLVTCPAKSQVGASDVWTWNASSAYYKIRSSDTRFGLNIVEKETKKKQVDLAIVRDHLRLIRITKTRSPVTRGRAVVHSDRSLTRTLRLVQSARGVHGVHAILLTLFSVVGRIHANLITVDSPSFLVFRDTRLPIRF